MSRVLNVLTVPMGRNGMALLLGRVARECGGIDIACFGNVPGDMAEYFESSRLFPLPDRVKSPFAYFRELRKLVGREGFRAVHVHGNSATMALDLLSARAGGAKALIAQGHNTGAVYARTEKLLRPLFYSLCGVRCACGEEAGRFLYGGRGFTVLPVPVDTRSYGYDADLAARYRESLGIPSGSFLIGNAASMTPQKGQAALIRSLALLPESAALAIAGDGPLREELAAEAERAGVKGRVYMPGAVRDMRAFYSACDAFCLPSEREGLPTCVLEAVCAGLNCVVSDTVTRECAVSGAVRFVPAREEDIARALAEVQAGGREALSREGARAVEASGHGLREAAQKYAALWEQAVREGAE